MDIERIAMEDPRRRRWVIIGVVAALGLFAFVALALFIDSRRSDDDTASESRPTGESVNEQPAGESPVDGLDPCALVDAAALGRTLGLVFGPAEPGRSLDGDAASCRWPAEGQPNVFVSVAIGAPGSGREVGALRAQADTIYPWVSPVQVPGSEDAFVAREAGGDFVSIVVMSVDDRLVEVIYDPGTTATLGSRLIELATVVSSALPPVTTE
jgi:hypothetical protein